MTIINRLKAALACLALVSAASARAQEGATTHPLTVSAGVAYERSVFEEIPSDFEIGGGGSNPHWSGAISGPALRIAAAYGLIGPLDLGARFEYARLGGALTVTPSDSHILLSGSVPDTQRVTYQNDFDVRWLRLDVHARYRLPVAGLAVELGATVADRKFVKLRQTVTLILPENARFKNPGGFPMELDGRRLVLHDGPLDEPPTVFGAEAGLSATIPIDGGFAAVPNVMLRKEFSTTLSSGETFFSWYASAGLTISYTLPSPATAGPDGSELLPPPTEPPPAGPREARPSFSASIDLHSIDADGRRIGEALVSSGDIHRTHRLLVPTVLFFDRNSSAIPARFLDRAGSVDRHLSADSIARLAPDAAYYHLLDIIGRASTVGTAPTLHAGHAPDEKASLARARAESLRGFMAERWRVDPATIAIKLDGEPDTGVRVELGAPGRVADAWTERYFTTTPIRVDPAIEAEAGVKSWALTFTQNGNVLARQRSDDAGDGELDLAMLLGSHADGKLPSPITAELAAEDSAGQRTSVVSTLAFARAPGATAADSVVTIHDLFGPAALPGSEEIAAIARSVAESRVVNVHITVSPVFIVSGTNARMAGTLDAIAARLHDELNAAGVALEPEAVRAVPAGSFARDERGRPEDAMLDAGVRVVVAARQ